MTPWTATCLASLTMGFSRQEYWSGLPCPPLGHLPNPGIEFMSLLSPALADRFFIICITWEAHIWRIFHIFCMNKKALDLILYFCLSMSHTNCHIKKQKVTHYFARCGINCVSPYVHNSAIHIPVIGSRDRTNGITF